MQYFTNMYAERLKSRGQQLTFRTKFILEVGIPSFSICALLGVTAYITSDAVEVIKANGADDDVNIYFLFGFASANFLVDLISASIFYLRRNNIFLTFTDPDDIDEILIADESNSSSNRLTESTSRKSTANLNMISAFTHVGGDTLRTIAVFIAAVVSATSNIAGSLTDAWAAVIVSITIVACVVPLAREIYGKANMLLAEENSTI